MGDGAPGKRPATAIDPQDQAVGKAARTDALALNADQCAALAAALAGANVCVLGKAGTGKSFVLRHIRAALEARGRRVAVVAAYASAAHAAGGVTVHSFLKPLPQPKVWRTRAQFNQMRAALLDSARKDLSSGTSSGGGGWFRAAHVERMNEMRGLHTLIFDELSLLSPELFQLVDATMRAARRNARPFGGVQLIAVGDPGQLPPVPMAGEDVRYVFEDDVWCAVDWRSVVLRTVVRQADVEFVELLDAVRAGELQYFKDWPEPLRERLLARTTARGARVLDADGNEFPAARLRATNAKVDQDNMEALERLPGELRTYPVRVLLPASAGGAWTDGLEAAASSAGRAEEELRDAAREGKWRDAVLKEGATVVLTSNLDVNAGLFNGAIGVVQALDPAGVRVRFRGGTALVERVEFPLDDGETRVSVMPLRAAYAFTIDKSQGLTLDACIVSLTPKMRPGAAYTALSRVRSLDSLVVETPDGMLPADVFERCFVTADAVQGFCDAMSA